MTSHPAIDPNDPRLREVIEALFGRVFGGGPVGPDVRFADIEDAAHEVGRAVARGLCERAAASQLEPAPASAPCPDCGRACPGTASSRPLIGRDGPVALAEVEHHCPRCRRAFFPLADDAGAGPSPLQPRGRGGPGPRRGRGPV
jgi:hypothetical protein